jgi:hypothetical protein
VKFQVNVSGFRWNGISFNKLTTCLFLDFFQDHFFLSAWSNIDSRSVVVSIRIYDASYSNLLLEASFPQSLQTDDISTYSHSQIIMYNVQLKERR